MSSIQLLADRVSLHVVSCRKPDPELAELPRRRRGTRETLTVPKRAGTYMLFRGPLEWTIQEDDLVSEPDADTDAGDRPDRPRTAEQHDAWREWQRATEDRIARILWALGPLVLYVHGYNTKPGDALRAGVRLQEALDRHHVGATVVVFTWPSAGHLADYFPDQKAAGRFGSYALVNLLMSLRRTPPTAVPLHCVAHSMGTYVVTRALGTIVTLQLERALPRPGPILSEVAYMEPDIDYDILCSGYTGPAYDSPSYLEIPDGYGATTLTERLTVYCTTNDMALFASLFKNRTKRLGAYGPGLECPQIIADLARVLTGEPADRAVARTATKAPRWYRLRYQPTPPAPGPGLLRGMAAFWGGLGTFAVNPVVVALVKWKKHVQRVLRIAKGLVPVAAAGGAGIMAWLTKRPLWAAAFLLSVGALLLYFLAWLRARAIQKREDDVPGPSIFSSPSPQPIPTVPPGPPLYASVATIRSVINFVWRHRMSSPLIRRLLREDGNAMEGLVKDHFGKSGTAFDPGTVQRVVAQWLAFARRHPDRDDLDTLWPSDPS